MIDNDTRHIARIIEHTLLLPQAVPDDIHRLCCEAVDFDFKGVCVNPWHAELAVEYLSDVEQIVVAVTGFPLGQTWFEVKRVEVEMLKRAGVDEMDMVINMAAFKAGDYNAVSKDIEVVVNTADPLPVKVIIETALLENHEKVTACEIAVRSGARFVKTCTGFMGGGATVKDIELMRSCVPDHVGVKASGGIKTFDQALALEKAGADRIGASASIDIVGGRL